MNEILLVFILPVLILLIINSLILKSKVDRYRHKLESCYEFITWGEALEKEGGNKIFERQKSVIFKEDLSCFLAREWDYE